jgi:hypothetical protein
MTSLAVRCEEVTKTFRKNGSSGHLPLRRAYVKGIGMDGATFVAVFPSARSVLFNLAPIYQIPRMSVMWHGRDDPS